MSFFKFGKSVKNWSRTKILSRIDNLYMTLWHKLVTMFAICCLNLSKIACRAGARPVEVGQSVVWHNLSVSTRDFSWKQVGWGGCFCLCQGLEVGLKLGCSREGQSLVRGPSVPFHQLQQVDTRVPTSRGRRQSSVPNASNYGRGWGGHAISQAGRGGGGQE